ncbi:3'(2'),5'-bisphosphate nucleotidase CysQ [Aliidiomarina maris]|uniref:3'(2'),5'-bisphosphate nucleotidase CysQ n=1 Tax=Aliidiomarina maris TaxID=531312 RepID=A0A327X226_9GAMM|nr:3'(2'),5'-bisphosphate nucleotidase CysQ [Aliidiomarina maris]RAJ99184.1 3'(2'),5'-bisphosphate nucleotidase [Aliidiomarina maris]RUO27670.1 3'(2'),5'-bisphosphate nucleotidase [Aliidiomarina maris]
MAKPLQQALASILRDTGALVLDHYRRQDFTVTDKADDSPVTSADLAASEFLLAALQRLTPDIPVLSEEALVPWVERRNWQRYWLIDPIDGTQEFIQGSGDFAIAVALIDNFQPVLGGIYWPTEQRLYQGGVGLGAQRLDYSQSDSPEPTPMQVRRLHDPAQDELVIAISRRQNHAKVAARMTSERAVRSVMTGSCSLKACMVADGSADCFLRLGPTGEWDTGAAQVIVEQAGGRLLSEHFEPITYNRTASLANPNFMVLGDPRVDWLAVFPRLLA